MPVESENDRLALLSDFGVDVEIGGETITGILDNEWQDMNGIAVTVPVLTVRTSDVTNYLRGQALTIAGIAYTIQEKMTDGQGIVHIILQET